MGWFDNRAGMAALFVLLLCIVSVVLLARREQAARLRLLLVLALTLAAVAALVGWIGRGLDADEAEHLHSSWLVSQGEIPYRDFWQHHPPMTWLLLSPIMGHFPHSASVVDFARGLSLLLSLAAWAIAFLLAIRLHGYSRGMLAVFAVLWAGSIIPGEFYNLRPDLIANVISMAAVLLLARSRGRLSVVASGLLFGLAASFTPKHVPFLLLVPIVLLSERLTVHRYLKLLHSYLFGVALGVAPLFFYLHAHGIIGRYWYWVYQFNGGDKLIAGGLFPIIPLAMVAAWAVRRQANRWQELKPAERVTFTAVLLSLVTMFIYKGEAKFLYHLQMFLLLSSALGVGEAKLALSRLVETRRAWIAGLAAGVYLIGSVQVWQWLSDGSYFASRVEIANLIRLADGGTVVAMTPRHPIFAHDATPLHMSWQWTKYMWSEPVKGVLRGMPAQIMESRPAIVMAGEEPTGPAVTDSPDLASIYFQGQLRHSGIATDAQARQLDAFLNTNYRLVRIRHWYWVRNDIPLPASAWAKRQ